MLIRGIGPTASFDPLGAHILDSDRSLVWLGEAVKGRPVFKFGALAYEAMYQKHGRKDQ